MENFENELGLLTNKELATLLGVSPGTLNVWRSQKKIPYVKIGGMTGRGKIAYNKKDILAWLDRGRQGVK